MFPFFKKLLLCVAVSVSLLACGGSGDSDDDDGSAVNFTGDAPSAGRLLVATQCAQCHGTDGYSSGEIDTIAGESYSELMEETVEDADESDELMGFHGGVYLKRTSELQAIADYLSRR